MINSLRERFSLVTTGKDPLSDKTSFYLGIDPTAPSLHLGHLSSLVLACRLKSAGHLPYLLIGSATALIGDPAGKKQERPLLSGEKIEENANALREQIGNISALREIPILDNIAWLGDLKLVDFLRDVGKEIRLGAMLGKESVRARLSEGLSFAEFSYQALQACDFLYLYDQYGITLQLGGNDQWGNITAGIELVRKVRKARVSGITVPLLTDSAGNKLGKSEKGKTLWLDAQLTSPYHLYQGLRNLNDPETLLALNRLTLLEDGEIASLAGVHAQSRLAEEVVRFVHGDVALANVQQTIEVLNPGSITSPTAGEHTPHLVLRKEELEMSLVSLLTRFQLSRSAAKRLLSGGGIYINQIRALPKQTLQLKHFPNDKHCLLSIGKKRKILIALR